MFENLRRTIGSRWCSISPDPRQHTGSTKAPLHSNGDGTHSFDVTLPLWKFRHLDNDQNETWFIVETIIKVKTGAELFSAWQGRNQS
jgi:hypothetical protein